MLGRYSVKKPYTVIVGIIVAIILGVISFTKMTTDLLPSMDFPYVIVYTTYVGATPEQVEEEITRPMEAAFATLTDIKEITSQSSDNLALVVLEFNDTVDMNTVLIEINSTVTELSGDWNDGIGTPAIMKINPDMLPVSIVSVAKEGMDLIELSEYVEDTLIPEYEKLNGVARVSASGLVTQEVDITIEQTLIDVLNSAVLKELDEELSEVEQELNDAQAQINDGKRMLSSMRSMIMSKLNQAKESLDNFETGKVDMIAGLEGQRAGLQQQLTEVNTAIESLEGLISLTEEDKAKLQELEQTHADLVEQKKQLEQQIEALGATTTTEQELKEAYALRDELQAEKQKCQDLIDALTGKDAETLRSAVRALEEKIGTEEETLKGEQAALESATNTRDATKQRIEELKRRIAAMEVEAATPQTTQEGEVNNPDSDEATPKDKPQVESSTPEPEGGSTETGEGEGGEAQEPTDAKNPVEADPTGENESGETQPDETVKDEPTTDSQESAENKDDAESGEKGSEPPTSISEDAQQPREPSPVTDVIVEAQSMMCWRPVAFAEGETLDMLKSELASAEAALVEEEKAVTAAQEAVDTRKATITKLETERKSKQEALDALEKNSESALIDASNAKIKELDGRITNIESQIEELERDQARDKEAAKLRSELDTVNKQIEKIEGSDAYQAMQLIGSGTDVNAQYAQAVAGKAQLEAGLAQLDGYIAKLGENIIPGGMIDGIANDTPVEDARTMIEEAGGKVASGLAKAKEQLDEAAEKIAEARKEFEDKRQEAYEEAGLDGIITVQMVAQILGAQNMSMPAGYVYDVSEDEYLVRIGDKFLSLNELKKTKLFELGMESIDEVRLLDVATVEITDDSEDNFTKVDGTDGIMLSMEKQSTFSTTDVANRIAEHSKKLMSEDSGLKVVDLFNQGDYIKIIVDSVLSNLISGGGLAVLVLLLFLMDLRPTIIIAFSIPLSVVVAFVCMYFSNISLNVLSLSGLALGIGMLVDNSIVAIENIYRLRDEEGLPILTACVEGVGQISGALFSSTLTTISVFVPILFVTGMAHDLFMDIGLTIAYSLLASLVVALTVVPSMAATLLKNPKRKTDKERIGLFGHFRNGYVALLRGALKHKLLVIVATLALLAYSVLQVPNMNMSFMPQVNSNQMSASLPLDTTGDVDAQKQSAFELMQDMMNIEGVKSIGLNSDGGIMSMGQSGNELSYYIIVDTQAGRRNEAIAKDISALAEEKKLDLNVKTSTMDMSMMIGSGVTVNIYGDDLQTLQTIARDVAAIARETEGTAEVDDGLSEAVDELKITVDKEKAIDNHLTVAQVLQFVAQKLSGKVEITQAELDGKKLSLYMIDGRNRDLTPEDLMTLEMEVTSGDRSDKIQIGEIAEVEATKSLSTIERESQQRMVSVTFQAKEGYGLSHVSGLFEEKLKEYKVPEGYSVSLSGENETVLALMEDLVFMLAVAIALIFLIMVAQFQSFLSPIIVMFTMPLAFTGGLLALQWTHMDLSIVSMVGFLVLSGVVVNNGIVFVDTVNQLRIEGMEKKEALLRTGALRLRPILMTAATTVLGMSLMALAQGMGAEMMQPMAVVVIGGLTYATLMTLFIVPIFYDLLNGNKMKARVIEMREEEKKLNKTGNE